MITAILALVLASAVASASTTPTIGTHTSKPIASQPALHTKTAVYDLTNKKRK